MSEAMCKGSIQLGSACLSCSSCKEQINESLQKAMNPNAYAWRYRTIRGHDARWNLTEDRNMIQSLVETGKILVEPLFLSEEKAVNAAERDALIKIAFDPDVSDLSANPSHWASIIAYLALGGRIQGGKKLDTQNEVLERLKK
jgi:hypothetical protein